MFNFIKSPRVQYLYSINPMNILLVRSLNRLVRNTCFNYKFRDPKDELYDFNDLIEKHHKKLKKFMDEKIIGLDDNNIKIKNSLRDLFTEKYLVYPKLNLLFPIIYLVFIFEFNYFFDLISFIFIISSIPPLMVAHNN